MSDPKEVADLVAGLGQAKVAMFDGEEVDWVAASAAIDRAISALQSLSADLERVTEERQAESIRLGLEIGKAVSRAEAAEASISTLTEALTGWTEACAAIADEFSVANDKAKPFTPYTEGRRDAGEAIAAAIRALPTQGEQL